MVKLTRILKLTAFCATACAATFLQIQSASANPLGTLFEGCRFVVADKNGEATKGPSFDAMEDGILHGLLQCGVEERRLSIITLTLDPKQAYVGVRDDPAFATRIVGALKPLENIAITGSTNIHVMGRVNQSPRIGVRRGFVHFATLCDKSKSNTPLQCTWGDFRIKTRTTVIDTDMDDKVDRSFHEVSVFKQDGRLHMLNFWTPHWRSINTSARDWVDALGAFGIRVASKNKG